MDRSGEKEPIVISVCSDRNVSVSSDSETADTSQSNEGKFQRFEENKADERFCDPYGQVCCS